MRELVGALQVLDHDDGPGAELGEDPPEAGRDLARGRLGALARRLGDRFGEVARLVGASARDGRDVVEQVEDQRVGSGAADRFRPAPHDGVPRLFRAHGELAQQSALPDPSLSRNEDEAALRQRGDEGVHLRVATNDDGTDVHVAILAGEG